MAIHGGPAAGYLQDVVRNELRGVDGHSACHNGGDDHGENRVVCGQFTFVQLWIPAAILISTES